MRPATMGGREETVDHYIPKRRIPVTIWSGDRQGIAGFVFLDLDAASHQHQTILQRLNESAPFLPVGVGEEGRSHLFNKRRLTRVTAGRQVIQSDIFARGFLPWREEEADIVLMDGTQLSGKVWMPLQRETQRVSDYLNQIGDSFFVLLTGTGVHLVNAASVSEVALAESAGAPLAGLGAPDNAVVL
jgi:hypothetical protein